MRQNAEGNMPFEEGDLLTGSARRALMVMSTVMLIVTFSKPTLNGGSLGMVTMIDFQYPGTLFGIGTAALLYVHWRYHLIVTSPTAGYRRAVLEKLNDASEPPGWLKDHLRTGGLVATLDTTRNRQRIDPEENKDLLDDLEEQIIEHWCSNSWKIEEKSPVRHSATCLIPAFPGYKLRTVQGSGPVTFQSTRADIRLARPDQGDDENLLAVLDLKIRDLPLNAAVKKSLQQARRAARIWDRSFSDGILPHGLAFFVWGMILFQSGAYVIATCVTGSLPDGDGLLGRIQPWW